MDHPFLFIRLLPPPFSSLPLTAEGTPLASVIAAGNSSRAAFFVSASPITLTLLASHFWKGCATKYPSAVNQVVNGASIWRSDGVEDDDAEDDVVVTVR